jgi:hypothetical protein
MKQFLLAIAVLLMATATAYGDGGAMLLHQDSGPFTITLFAAPQPLHTGTAEISAMVQDRTTNQTLQDTQIDLAVDQNPPVHLEPGQSSNKLMQSASIHFAQPGQHKLAITVRRNNQVAQLATDCNVEADHSRAALLWFYLLLPLVAIALFAIQQKLKLRQAK